MPTMPETEPIEYQDLDYLPSAPGIFSFEKNVARTVHHCPFLIQSSTIILAEPEPGIQHEYNTTNAVWRHYV